MRKPRRRLLAINGDYSRTRGYYSPHAKRVVHALEKAQHIAIIVHGNGESHSNKYQLLDGDTPVTVSASKTVTRQSPSESKTVTQRLRRR